VQRDRAATGGHVDHLAVDLRVPGELGSDLAPLSRQQAGWPIAERLPCGARSLHFKNRFLLLNHKCRRSDDQPHGSTHVYHQFVVRAARRDDLRTHLTAQGIGNEVYYPVPFHRQQCFQHLGHRLDAFPNADAAAADVLALPMYPELTLAQQEYVVATIAGFYA